MVRYVVNSFEARMPSQKVMKETVITIIYKLKESEKVKPRDEIIVIRENKKYIYAINPH